MKAQEQISDSTTISNNTKDSSTLLLYGSKYDTLGIPREKYSPVESVFEGSEYIVQQINPVKRNRIDEDWVTVHLIIALAMIAWARVFYKKRFGQLIRSFFGQRYQGIMMREGNIFRERVSIPLLLTYLITYSLFIHRVVIYYSLFENSEFSGFKLFSLIILFVLLLWIIKNVSMIMVGNLFKNPIILTDYIVTSFVFNVNTGIALIPILIAATYLSANVAIISGLLLMLGLFVYRVLRQLFTGFGYVKFSLFNRILYLCTFEIAPILVLIKLILNNLN